MSFQALSPFSLTLKQRPRNGSKAKPPQAPSAHPDKKRQREGQRETDRVGKELDPLAFAPSQSWNPTLTEGVDEYLERTGMERKVFEKIFYTKKKEEKFRYAEEKTLVSE